MMETKGQGEKERNELAENGEGQFTLPGLHITLRVVPNVTYCSPPKCELALTKVDVRKGWRLDRGGRGGRHRLNMLHIKALACVSRRGAAPSRGPL